MRYRRFYFSYSMVSQKIKKITPGIKSKRLGEIERHYFDSGI